MGGFYGSIQVRGDDRDAVRGAVKKLAHKNGGQFLVGPALSGWIGIYPEHGGQDPGVAREVARRLSGELLYLVVHDDDLFAYEYYRDGKRVDRYNSCPDYFDAVSARERRELRGRPETFAHLAPDPERFRAMRDRLAAPGDDLVFASELLVEFAEALGIPNALTSYEYLKENDETEGIEGWDQFVHIPDLPVEEEAGRHRDATILRFEPPQAAGEGLLLAEAGGLPGSAAVAPQWCPSPDGQGFLVAWMNPMAGPNETRTLERYGPPWASGPQPAGPPMDPRLFTMEASASGRYLALGQAAGDWRALVWDLQENRRAAETPQVGAVMWVGFARDESSMVSISAQGENGQVVVLPLPAGDARVIPVKYAKLGALHPSGKTLVVVDHRDRLVIVDLASGTVGRTLFVGGRQDLAGPYMTMVAQAQAQLATMDLGQMEQMIRKQQEQVLKNLQKSRLPAGFGSVEEVRQRMSAQLEEHIQRMREQFAQMSQPGWQAEQVRGNEIVCRLKFDPAGDRLFAATSQGVRVYAWQEMLQSPGDTMPSPVRSIDTAAAGAHMAYVYDLDHDPDRGVLLFGGADGQVRYLDLEEGRTGALFELPGRPPILRLGLSRDRSVLALTCHPDLLARKSKPRGPRLQFWNYPALWQRPLS